MAAEQLETVFTCSLSQSRKGKPLTKVQRWLRSQRDTVVAELSPPMSVGSQPHTGLIPNSEHQRLEEQPSGCLAVGISGDSISLGDWDCTSQGKSTPKCIAPAWRIHSGLQLQERPHCHAHILQRCLLATQSSDFNGPSVFWGNFWKRTTQLINCEAWERGMVSLTFSNSMGESGNYYAK